MGTPNAGGVGEIAFFDRSRSLRLRRLTVENLCLAATAVRIHDGALADKDAVSSTTLEVPGSRSLLISVTVQLISTRLVVRKSVDDTTPLHLCDTLHRMLAVRAIVEPTASMRVQNYALRVAESTFQADR